MDLASDHGFDPSESLYLVLLLLLHVCACLLLFSVRWHYATHVASLIVLGSCVHKQQYMTLLHMFLAALQGSFGGAPNPYRHDVFLLSSDVVCSL